MAKSRTKSVYSTERRLTTKPTEDRAKKTCLATTGDV